MATSVADLMVSKFTPARLDSYRRKLQKLVRDPEAFVVDAIRKRQDPTVLKETKLAERSRMSVRQSLARAARPQRTSIYLDVTRTMLRKGGHHTGITRVEFAYILFLVQQSSWPVYFVCQRGGPHLSVTSPETLATKLLELGWIASADEVLTTNLDPMRSVTSQLLEQTGEDVWNAYLDGVVPGGIYINASHAGVEKDRIFTQLKNSGGFSQVFFVHDLIPVDYPEFVDQKTADSHCRRMFSVAAHADVVLVNSEYTRDGFRAFAQARRLRVPELRVLHIGVEEFVRRAAGSPVAPVVPSFLYVSTIEPRKNHSMLLNLWRSMITSGMDPMPQLILVGKRGWNNESLFRVLDRSQQLRPHVQEFNSVDDATLLDIYLRSTALVCPSHVEGWGMPIVEALTLGVPAIVSDLPSLQEASQGLATSIDAIDGPGWVSAICAHMGRTFRQERCEHIRRHFVPPTWEQHCQQLEAILSDIRESSLRAGYHVDANGQ